MRFEDIEIGDELPAEQPDVRVERVREFAKTAGMLTGRFVDHQKAREQGLPASLVQRFGGEAPAVVDAAVLPRPLDPIVPGIDVTRAEVEFAVTHEGALDADDILHRRTRIGLVQADADAARPETEAIVGELLG